jgi:hypothetical protein
MLPAARDFSKASSSTGQEQAASDKLQATSSKRQALIRTQLNSSTKLTYTGEIKMNIKEAQAITHTLSKPGKMPGFAYSTPAHECKTGTKLRLIPNSVCSNCYAFERGRYRFQNVKDAQYKRFKSLTHPLWVEAMAAQINSKKVKFFRWHDSGDVQNLDHLRRIYSVCKLTPDVQHWMPTREAWTKDYIAEAPKNLVVRFSIPMIDQAAGTSWPNTSTVSTKKIDVTCPAPLQGNKCKDCRACWDKSVSNVCYGEH